MIAFRLGRLEAPAAELLRVAAVIGRDVDGELLERVVQLGEDEFLAALEEALGAGAPGRVRRAARVLPVLPRADPGDAVREHVRAAAGEDPQAGGGGDRGRAGSPAGALSARARLPLHSRGRSRRRREGDHLRAPRRRAGDDDARARGGGRALRPRARRPAPIPARGVRAPVRAAAAPRARPGSAAASARPASSAFRDAAALAEQLGDGASLARAAIGASRLYVQPPGVVDARADRDDRAGARARARAVARAGPAARLSVRGDLLLARARSDGGAQRRGDGDCG